MGYDDREKEALKIHLRDYLTRIGVNTRGNGDFQFRCINRNHNDARPSAHFYDRTNSFYCFGCGEGGDIYKAIELNEGIFDFPKVMDFARLHYGAGTYSKTASPPRRIAAPVKEAAKPTANYTEFYRAARAARSETDFWTRRGFNEDTLKAFGVGYCAAWTHPEVDNWRGSPRPMAIIRNSESSYIAKDTRPGVKSFYFVGGVELFNAGALRSGEPVFIAEAAIDAMSLYQAGARQVVSINGATHYKSLLRAIRDMKPEARPPSIIIAMDNDEAGRGAVENIINGDKEKSVAGLKKFGIPYTIFNSYGGNGGK